MAVPQCARRKGWSRKQQDRPNRSGPVGVARGTRHRERGEAGGRRRSEARAEEAGLRGDREGERDQRPSGQADPVFGMVRREASQKVVERFFVAGQPSAGQRQEDAGGAPD